jgi:hypothetical protein
MKLFLNHTILDLLLLHRQISNIILLNIARIEVLSIYWIDETETEEIL